MDTYLSVKEVAELSNCAPSFIYRNIKGKKFETILDEKNKLKISLKSLDTRLQNKYYKQQGQLPTLIEAEVPAPKRFDEFSDHQRQQITLWTDIVRQWQDYRKRYTKQKTKCDELFVDLMKRQKPQLHISVDILYRKQKALKSHDLAGLIDKRGTYNKGQSKMTKEVFDTFLWQYLDERQPSMNQCIQLTEAVLRETDPQLLPLPSYATFRRELGKLSTSVVTLGREGDKAYRDKCGPYIVREYSQMHSNDYWIADNHTLDIISKSDKGEICHRLSLTCFIDARSGMPTGWNITDNPNSASTIIALRNGIKRCGIPKAVYMDNGSEFLTYDIAGRGHRKRKSSEGEYIPPHIFQRLGIEMRNALVRNARAKPIERTFLDFKGQVSKCFVTYCGGNSQERPENLKKILKEDHVPYDSEVREIINDLLAGYMANQHYGGSVAADKNLTKVQVFKKRLPDVVRQATDGELDLLLQRSTRVQKIGRNGVYVKIYGLKLFFGMAELALHQGKEVYLRYDPSDLSDVRVYSAPDDIYLLTAAMNTETMLLFDDNQENVKIAQEKVRGIIKETKTELKNIMNAVPEHRRIDALDLKIRQSKANMVDNPLVGSTKLIKFIMSNEQKEIPDGTENIESITIDMEAMNRNAERRKRSVY